MYRIDPDGNPRRVWSHAQDVVYAIAFDAAGRALLGAGNKGNHLPHRIAHAVHGAAGRCPPRRSRHFRWGRDGRLYAATGNVGKVYEIGPGLEREGTVESDVFDRGSVLAVGPAELRRPT